jgi:hypothetical protein
MKHVSYEYLGEEPTFKPRVPWVSGESQVKRICVAPTPFHCFIAIPSKNKPLYVYEILPYYKKNVDFIEPDGFVLDKDVTKEKWLLEPCKFRLTGYFTKEFSQKFFLETVGSQEDIENQYRVLDHLLAQEDKINRKFFKSFDEEKELLSQMKVIKDKVDRRCFNKFCL